MGYSLGLEGANTAKVHKVGLMASLEVSHQSQHCCHSELVPKGRGDSPYRVDYPFLAPYLFMIGSCYHLATALSNTKRMLPSVLLCTVEDGLKSRVSVSWQFFRDFFQ